MASSCTPSMARPAATRRAAPGPRARESRPRHVERPAQRLRPSPEQRRRAHHRRRCPVALNHARAGRAAGFCEGGSSPQRHGGHGEGRKAVSLSFPPAPSVTRVVAAPRPGPAFEATEDGFGAGVHRLGLAAGAVGIAPPASAGGRDHDGRSRGGTGRSARPAEEILRRPKMASARASIASASRRVAGSEASSGSVTRKRA